jgi:Family of unknown function (DUF6348)
MGMSASGAEALKREFGRLLHPGQLEADVLELPHWDLRVRMKLEQYRGSPAPISVAYRATSHLGRLAHPVEDYEVGMGPTRRDGVQMAVNMYMGSVFPVIHSICCTQHSAHEVKVTDFDATDAESGIVRKWRLVVGPHFLTGVGATTKARDEIPHDLFSRLLNDDLPRLAREPGTYWFKCFAGRQGDNVAADCFLNKEEFTPGKDRFLEWARTIPREKNLWNIKQHILVQPLDPEVLQEFRNRRRQTWQAAMNRSGTSIPPDNVALVFDALEAFHDCAGLGGIRETLEARGVPADSALKLWAFLPAACARECWGKQSICFAEEYTLLNFKTKRALNLPLKAEPLFQAALSVVASLRKAEAARELLLTILSQSSEDQLARYAAEQESEICSTMLIVPTTEDVEGEINEELLKAIGLRKPWWRFW